VSADTFDAHFDHFTQTATRLQALPEYTVGGAEAERIQAHRERRARPERSVCTDPWLARIASTTLANRKTWSKLCVVDNPLTSYQRYQIPSLVEDQAAGNRIFIAERWDVPNPGPDVWLFDADTPRAHALVMNYAPPDGTWRGFEDVTDPERVAEITERLCFIKALAVPLNVFLANSSGRCAPCRRHRRRRSTPMSGSASPPCNASKREPSGSPPIRPASGYTSRMPTTPPASASWASSTHHTRRRGARRWMTTASRTCRASPAGGTKRPA
jgi:hypothetical protein